MNSALNSENKYLIVAFYQFVNPYFTDLESLRTRLKTEMLSLGIRGTILVAPEGVNSTIVGEETAVRSFLTFLRTIPGLENLVAKESYADSIPFKRTLVKIKKVLIPFGREEEIEQNPLLRSVNPAVRTGKYVAPAELKKWLDEGDPNLVMVDTRNGYEIVKGTFKGAQDWKLRHFRDFPRVLDEKRKELEGKKVVMFCTGGIRCEKATAYAADLGLDVYQIDGGILKYFEDVGGAHYDGDCFVFDYRIAVDPNLKPVPYTTAFPDGRPLDALDGYAVEGED